ncbi:MAG: helix-turn-helix domain-containing protein [Ignavibacteriaceae bacterium]
MNFTGLQGFIAYNHQIGQFKITETHYSPELVLNAHSHEDPVLSIVLDGSLTELYNNKVYEHNPMSIIYKPAHKIHSNKFHQKGARCLNIEFTQNWVEHLDEIGLKTDHTLNTRNFQNNSILMRLKNELKTNDKYSELIIEGLLIELFADIMRLNENKEKITTPRWLIEITNYMDLTTNEKLSINELAKKAGINSVHLINTFKKYYHITPGEYLRQKKIDLVCWELRNSNKSLIDIALQFKFSDQSHFNKFFKKYVGVTPSQYLELHKISKKI